MTLFGFISILLIIGLMLAGLYLAKRAQRQIDEENFRKNRVREIRLNLFEIDEILRTLLIYDCDTNLLDNFSYRMQSILDDGLESMPGNQDLLEEKRNLDTILAQIDSLKKTPTAPAIPESDRQIALVKKHFHRAVKMIRQMHTTGAMDKITADHHKDRLMKNALMTEVNAYCLQAQDARENGEVSAAANFFQYAKDLLTATDIDFPEKDDEIQRLSREVHGVYETIPNDESKSS